MVAFWDEGNRRWEVRDGTVITENGMQPDVWMPMPTLPTMER